MKVREILKDCEQWMPPRNMGSSSPMVSVLLPTFRRAQCGLFEKAVQSVINQEFKNWELIIIDDASTDGTADLIAHFMEIDDRIGCIRHRFNVGLPAISEYEGYMRARGEYIAFIFDDNEWERDYLSQTIDLMVCKKLDASYGIVRLYYDEEEYVELGKADAVAGMHSLDANNFIPNSGVILRRNVIETVGLYDPHIAVTRLCDWGLWKRVNKRFAMYETGVLVGSEKGASLSDSLGNSYKLNSWVVAERENQVNDEELLIKNFADIEINGIHKDSSTMYRDYIAENYCDYKSKLWYREENPREVTGNIRRVLVLASSFNASCELVFGRLKNQRNIVFCFRMSPVLYELALADAVIIIRDIMWANKYRDICVNLGIPCFLYMDDNYIKLAEMKGFECFVELKNALLDKKTQDYSGILATTSTLVASFKEYGIHEDVFLIEPVLCQAGRLSEPKECITFAYMGGPFRDIVFETAVLPAIRKIAEAKKTKLVCPSRLNLDGLKLSSNIEVVQIEFNLSLNEVLRVYETHHPHILIHCGPDIENNKYKTENGLMNAVQLGAVFAPSREQPYGQHDGRYYVCSENTPDAWYETLNALAESAERRKELFDAAKDYCLSRYSIENTIKQLDKTLDGIEPVSSQKLIQRLIAGINQYVPGGYRLSVPAASRSLVGRCIIYSGGIRKKRVYRVVCTKESFSQVGVFFVYSGTTTGNVNVSVDYNGDCLGKASLSFDECVRDSWTYIDIKSKGNMLNKLLEITLEYTYETNPGHAGVAEDGEKITLPVKVLRKLNLTRGVTDLLFADFI